MRYLIALGVVLVSLPVSAAEMVVRPSLNGAKLIQINGVIRSGDEDQFLKLIDNSNVAIVILNSEGGSVKAAIEIGRMIRLRNFATVVLPNTLCASACALTWLAGTPRYLDTYSRLGFHAAYRVIDGKVTESGTANALIGAYLNQIGLQESVITYVTSAPPEGISWLSHDAASAIGISFQSPTNLIIENQEIPKSTLINDPIGATTAFYSALAIADGDAASALVVPEKRGKGAFNEDSIRNYFGAMSIPLMLTSTKLIGQNVVRVNYTYKTNSGIFCNGRADVETTFIYGKTLISRIKALDKC